MAAPTSGLQDSFAEDSFRADCFRLRFPRPIVASNSLTLAHHFVSIKLMSRNYLFWRTQLLPFWNGQGLLDFVDSTAVCPAVVALPDSPILAAMESAMSTAAVHLCLA